MNSIGGTEIILILIIATIVIGPQKLQVILKNAARLFKKLRAIGNELRAETGIREEVEELKKLSKEIVADNEIGEAINEANKVISNVGKKGRGI